MLSEDYPGNPESTGGPWYSITYILDSRLVTLLPTALLPRGRVPILPQVPRPRVALSAYLHRLLVLGEAVQPAQLGRHENKELEAIGIRHLHGRVSVRVGYNYPAVSEVAWGET